MIKFNPEWLSIVGRRLLAVAIGVLFALGPCGFSSAEQRTDASIVLENSAPYTGSRYEYDFAGLPLPAAIIREQARQISRNAAQSGALAYNAAWERGTDSRQSIAAQRNAFILVAAGVGSNDRSLIDLGLRAIEWAFSRQAPDGSFQSVDRFNSISLFVESSARSINLLLQSDQPEDVKRRSRALLPRLQAAAHWLAAPRNLTGLNRIFTHRLLLVGTALQEVALLTNDDGLATAGRPLVEAGLAQQRPDGVFPERNGADTEYQSFSVELVTRYASLTKDPGFRPAIMAGARQGASWLAGKVSPEGDIDYRGNARTGGCGRHQLNKDGKPKNVGYKHIPLRLSYYAYFWGDSALVASAVNSIHRAARKFDLQCP